MVRPFWRGCFLPRLVRARRKICFCASITTAQSRQRFAVLGGTRQSAELMEKFLQKEHVTDAALPDAINVAFDAWSVGRMALGEDAAKELPDRDAIRKHRDE